MKKVSIILFLAIIGCKQGDNVVSYKEKNIVFPIVYDGTEDLREMKVLYLDKKFKNCIFKKDSIYYISIPSIISIDSLSGAAILSKIHGQKYFDLLHWSMIYKTRGEIEKFNNIMLTQMY